MPVCRPGTRRMLNISMSDLNRYWEKFTVVLGSEELLESLYYQEKPFNKVYSSHSLAALS